MKMCFALAVSLLVGCVQPANSEDAFAAFDSGMDAPFIEDDAPLPDAPRPPPPDAFTPDAPPPDASIVDLICTGNPVPEGLPCVFQRPEEASRCGSEGAVVFGPRWCQLATGSECGSTPRGGFNTFEECAVACARAGRCNLAILSRPPMNEIPPMSCTSEEWRCGSVAAPGWLDTSHCSYFERMDAMGRATLFDLGHPGEWEFMRAASLMPQEGGFGFVFCY